MTLKTFKTRCANIDDTVMFFDEGENPPDRCVEDDGCLHIVRCGVRACFDVGNGQTNSAAVQNDKTRSIMTQLGLAKFINDMVLLDEDEDEEEECEGYCSHCGRG